MAYKAKDGRWYSNKETRSDYNYRKYRKYGYIADINNNKDTTGEEGISLLLGFAIFFMPVIFAWVTLLPGYSTLAKVISFSWMAVVLISLLWIKIMGTIMGTGYFNL